MEFRSRAVKSLVELHEIEMRRFLATWDRYVESGAALPEGRDDPDYASPDHLVTHAVRAARGYLIRVSEWVGRPASELDPTRDPAAIVPRLHEHVEETLAAWRRHLAALEDRELASRHIVQWGGVEESFSVEQMLEHAVVHPMRHRIQLERILVAAESGVGGTLPS